MTLNGIIDLTSTVLRPCFQPLENRGSDSFHRLYYLSGTYADVHVKRKRILGWSPSRRCFPPNLVRGLLTDCLPKIGSFEGPKLRGVQRSEGDLWLGLLPGRGLG